MLKIPTIKLCTSKLTIKLCTSKVTTGYYIYPNQMTVPGKMTESSDPILVKLWSTPLIIIIASYWFKNFKLTDFNSLFPEHLVILTIKIHWNWVVIILKIGFHWIIPCPNIEDSVLDVPTNRCRLLARPNLCLHFLRFKA